MLADARCDMLHKVLRVSNIMRNTFLLLDSNEPSNATGK
jgi:hypothetical protein